MCRVASTRFGPTLEAPRLARDFVAGLLDRWELSELADNATLLTSELVTNAVVHAGEAPSLVVAVADGSLEIGVSDLDPRVPRRAGSHDFVLPADGNLMLVREGGRGIPLVDHLADEWGVAADEPGKQVWFRLEAADWSYRTVCQCYSDSVDRVRLQSGRFALAIPGAWDSHRDPA
jgi:anti-sigma regulatory factor (Ser/Thr protein kinase)